MNKEFEAFLGKGHGDRIIWIVSILIGLFSIFSVYSTGAKLSSGSQQSIWFLIKGHVAFLVIGYLLMFFIQKFDFRWLGRLSKIGLILGVGLLVATLLFGVTESGAKRSISVFGFKVQTIHFIELCVIVYLAYWLARVKENINDIKNVYVKILLFIALFCLGIMTQKTSASLILGFTCVVMLFVSQLKGKYFLATFVPLILAGIIGINVLLSDTVNPQSDNAVFKRLGTAKVRVENFFDGNTVHKESITTEAAIASSNLFPNPGANIHASGVKESYSDYIFAFFVEEWGILSGCFLIFLYSILFYRVVIMSRNISSSFGKYLSVGVGFLIVFQAMTHICVSVGIFPATGETLPLFSRGGMSILTTAISLGILLSISREAKEDLRLRKQEREKNRQTNTISNE